MSRCLNHEDAGRPADSQAGLMVAAISGLALSRRHGTGMQMMRILAEPSVRHWHVYWSERSSLPSDCCHSACIQSMPWLRKVRGEKVIRAAERFLGVAWWKGTRVNARKLRGLLQRRRWAADVAYVCVSSDGEAARARSILDVLGCPYVVHLWDMFHDGPLDPQTMRGYADLLSSADRVLVLTTTMAEEIRKFGCFEPSVIGFGQRVRPETADAPSPYGPLRLALVGSLGDSGNPFLSVLREAWNLLHRQGCEPQLVYIGRHLDRLPEAVRQETCSPPHLDEDEYHALLSSCHLALLPSPYRLDAFGRYSLPSRIGDYLMAGLPILASVAEESVTRSYLQQLEPGAVRFVSSGRELVEAANELCEPAVWPAAGRQARQFAETRLNIETVRSHVIGVLRDAARH